MSNRVDFKGDSSLPLVSFIIPTYNAEKTLKMCLDSIFVQKYPENKVEVLVIDGGSLDKTREIAGKYPVKILNNPLRLEDGPRGGKAIGVKNARGEFLCFLDSDNFLSSDRWLRKMIQPFVDDAEVVACETSRFRKRGDSAVNRFCSSLVLQTKNKDPFIPFTRKVEKTLLKKTAQCVIYSTKNAPPYVANGTIVRKEIIDRLGGFDFDTDLAARMINAGYVRFAESLDAGIYHSYVMSNTALLKKAIKRARLFIFFSGSRKGVVANYLPSNGQEWSAQLRGILSNLIIISPLMFALKKMRKDPDYAWLYYPITSLLVPTTYAIVLLTSPKGRALLLNRK
jgi:glycosyltransferase involved in cell wall biosynthesis